MWEGCLTLLACGVKSRWGYTCVERAIAEDPAGLHLRRLVGATPPVRRSLSVAVAQQTSQKASATACL